MNDEELIARLREKTVKKLPNNWQKGRKCPDCGSDATRPKCFFDYGPSCARHDPDAYDPPAWEEVPDPLSSAAADRIEALVKERDAAVIKRAAWELEAKTLQARLTAADAEVEKLRTLLEGWLELTSHCDIVEGVCCCGESMNGHSNPMDCGHTPLDHGAYIAVQLGEETRAALTTEERHD